VVERDGAVVLEARAASTPEAIAAVLETAPACQRIVLETGRMAPMLFHGLAALGLPVICIESRQAYQALKSLATHKTDRNDARGLAHLARTGFYKPVHVKSLPAHAVRALMVARKKLVGQRVTLENQIRGLAVVFGVRLPRGLSPRFTEQVIQASQGIAGLSGAMQGMLAARKAVLEAVAAIDRDMRLLARSSQACQRLMTIPGVGSISKCGDRRVRTLLYEAANVMLTRYRGALALKEWALGIARRSTMRKARVALARRLAIIMHAMLRHGTPFHAA
jgi:transposase